MGDRDSMTEQADKKRTKRRASDDYPTPGPVVDAFLDRIDWFRVRSFLEPCAGDGAIIARAADRITSPRRLVRGVELRHGGPGWIRADYLELPQLGVDLDHPGTIAGPTSTRSTWRSPIRRLTWPGSSSRSCCASA